MRVIVYIILFLVAAWVYSDAVKRGKSSTEAALWAIGTFLLLIVVLPIWLITRPKIKGRSDQFTQGTKEERTPVEEFDNLERLREEGVISEEEYQLRKKDLLRKQA